MVGQQVVGFRDSAYLYYPLFQWIDAQWASGVIPLWNPYCNAGMPVVHDGSSSIFYPGKLIFFVRALPYSARYGLYIAIHIPIAAAGTYWFARTMRANQVGATLAGFSYSFSGTVLFQSTNVVYLVSAAWLPFALCGVWLAFRKSDWKWAVWTGVFCALMVLGGDPQMCYHVGLVMCAFALHSFLRTRKRWMRAKSEQRAFVRPYRVAVRSCYLIAITVSVTFALAAIQILPSYVWSQQSIRARSKAQHPWEPNFQLPRSIYEVLSDASYSNEGNIRNGLLGDPIPNTHHDHAYQFSLPPWSVVGELIWPNSSGKAFPTHQRWVDGLAGAERMWIPSLYMGSLVFLLALIALNPFSHIRKFSWLSRLGLFFMIASIGWYGPVWLATEIAPNAMARLNLGAPVGGLYWMMVVFLPKYISFRYPAKLFVVAALAFSLLAALSLNRLTRNKEMRKYLIGAGVFLFGSVLFLALRNQLLAIGENTSSVLFGPFDRSGCADTLLFATLTTFMVVLVSMGLIVLQFRSQIRWPMFVLLFMSVCEIAFSNAWMVPKVESEVFERESRWKIWAEDRAHSVVEREVFAATFPMAWLQKVSRNRLTEIVEWQRETLHPKHHLETGLQLKNSFFSLEPQAVPFSGKDFLLSRNQGLFEIAPPKWPHGGVVNDSYPGFLQPASTRFEWANCNRIEITTDTNVVRPASSSVRDECRYELRIHPAPGWNLTTIDLSSGNEIVPRKTGAAIVYGTLGVILPTGGKYQIIAEYRPTEFYVGAWISGAAWSILLLSLFLTVVRSRR